MSHPPIVITAASLRHFLDCERHVWLDQHGDLTEREIRRSPFADLGWQFEDRVLAQLGPARPIPVTDWEDGVRRTRAVFSAGAGAVRGACLEAALPGQPHVVLRGRIDLLRRTNVGWQIIEIKSSRQAREADWMQLDLYLYLLELNDAGGADGELWLRADNAAGWAARPHTLRRDALTRTIDAYLEALDTPEIPPIFFGKHCYLCGWQSSCLDQAQTARDLALLPGLTRKTAASLRAGGLHSLSQIAAASVDDLRALPGVGKATADKLRTTARAMVDNRPIDRAPLPADCALPGLMLDIETELVDGVTHTWSLGWCHPDGRVEIAIVSRGYHGETLLLPDGQRLHIVRSAADGWSLVADAIRAYEGHLYHWSDYEKTMIRASGHPRTDELLARMRDLLKVVRATVMLPVRSYSIKTVAPYLGYHYPAGANYLTAWQGYERWRQTGDVQALAFAAGYQRADVESMLVIWKWLVSRSAD